MFIFAFAQDMKPIWNIVVSIFWRLMHLSNPFAHSNHFRRYWYVRSGWLSSPWVRRIWFNMCGWHRYRVDRQRSSIWILLGSYQRWFYWAFISAVQHQHSIGMNDNSQICNTSPCIFLLSLYFIMIKVIVRNPSYFHLIL